MAPSLRTRATRTPLPQHAKPGHPGGLVERAAFLGGGERALRRLHQTGRGLPGDLGALWAGERLAQEERRNGAPRPCVVGRAVLPSLLWVLRFLSFFLP